MSTKIYGGFRLSAGASWAAVHDHVMEFRKEIAGLLHDEARRELALVMCSVLDHRAVGLPITFLADLSAKECSAYVAAMTHYLAERRDSREDGEPIGLVLIPHADDDRIYGITFGDNSLQDLWLDKPFVERWPYWNNTDRPDDVTDEEWEYRRATWDQIVGWRSPAMSGFGVTCVDRYEPRPELEEALKWMPSFEERVRGLAVDMVHRERVREMGGEKGDGSPASRFFAIRKWLKTEEGKAAVAAKIEEVAGKLERVVTEDLVRAEP